MEQVILICCCLMGLFFLFRLMTAPIRWIWKLAINCICGFLVLVLCNLIGAGLGIRIGLNVLSVTLTGILGLPGIGLLLIINKIVV